jgi:hypothetical protein
MLVYGKVGTKAPFAVKILTLFKLNEVIEASFVKELIKSNRSKSFKINVNLVQKNILFCLFADATSN